MVKYHTNLIQGTPEWFQARCGLLTASEMKHIITPAKLQYAQNDKEKSHLYELAAQRITRYVEPHYMSDDMMRGKDDELDAKRYYCDAYANVDEMGFITNDKFGFTLGYSPDGMVTSGGVIEVKGRRQKFQIEVILANEMPEEFKIQVQTGLMVSEEPWCDFISFCGGIPMLVKRVEPDLKIQDAIRSAATIFHEKLDRLLESYADKMMDTDIRLVPTERRPPEEDMHL